MTRQKLAEWSADHVDLRLLTESFEGNPRRFVRVEERSDGRWTPIGRAELHPTIGVSLEGDLQGRVVADWPGPHSIRRTIRHRLTADHEAGDDSTLVLEHQVARVDEYRADIDESDFDPQQRWTLTPSDVSETTTVDPDGPRFPKCLPEESQ